MSTGPRTVALVAVLATLGGCGRHGTDSSRSAPIVYVDRETQQPVVLAVGAFVLVFAGPVTEELGKFGAVLLFGRTRAGAAPLSTLTIVLIGLAAVLSDPALVMGEYARLRALLVLPLVTTGLTGGALVCTVLVWRRREWGLPARLHYTAVALGAVGFTWFLASWNLLGFRF